MSAGWYCDNCDTFYLDVHVVTKITVSILPRDYAASVTLCSLRCFDEHRGRLNACEAIAQEHDRSQPRFRRYVGEEPIT